MSSGILRADLAILSGQRTGLSMVAGPKPFSVAGGNACPRAAVNRREALPGRDCGEVRVESTPGEGSTFVFTLPAA